MSYGSQSLCRAEYNAIQLAVRRGIVPVAAAGNEFDAGNPLEFPASLPHVLTIAAVNAAAGLLVVLELQPRRRPERPRRVDHDRGAAGAGRRRDAGRLPAAGRHELLGPDGLRRPSPGCAPRARTSRPTRSPRSCGSPRATSAARASTTPRASALLDVGAALAKTPPPRDPLEPNDDMVWVDGRAFGTAAPRGLHRPRDRAPGRARGRLRGPGRRLPRPGPQALEGARDRQAGLRRPDPRRASPRARSRSRSAPGAAASARRAWRRHAARARAPSASRCATARGRTRTFYVALGPQSGARSLDAGYRLTIRR